VTQGLAAALTITRLADELADALKDAVDALRAHRAVAEEDYTPGSYDDLVDRGIVSIYRGTSSFPCMPVEGDEFIAEAERRARRVLLAARLAGVGVTAQTADADENRGRGTATNGKATPDA
jgi:hypothetical protein